MGAGWVWLFLGLELEKSPRNWQVPPPRSLALSRDSSSTPRWESLTPSEGHSNLGQNTVVTLEPESACGWKHHQISFGVVRGVHWFVCVSAFYLGNHLNGLMDLHTKCWPIELFCMLCVSPLNQASFVLSVLPGWLLGHMCELNHCGEFVAINDFHQI